MAMKMKNAKAFSGVFGSKTNSAAANDVITRMEIKQRRMEADLTLMKEMMT
jgi:hypothetical protein